MTVPRQHSHKRATITVDKALFRGHLLVNGPVMVIMFGIIGLLIWLAKGQYVPGYFKLLGFLIGPLAAWIYWSIAITKWRIWAFTHVDDVHELHLRAVADKLIWPRDSFFNKTEIRTRKERTLISELEYRFYENGMEEETNNESPKQ